MDTFQFYNSVSRLALAIETSGLLAAVKNCRGQLTQRANENADGGHATSKKLAEAMLLRAGGDYIDHASRFSATDKLVAEQFHLQKLETTDYWDRLTDEHAPPSDRLGELVSLYSRLMFASSHLPRLVSLMQRSVAGGSVAEGAVAGSSVAGGSIAGSSIAGSSADGSAQSVAASGRFVLELGDLRIPADGAEERLESAADPDRIARVIDAANMIYQGVALLAGGTPQSLQLGSISGNKKRMLVFTGQRESATAVRRIIRHIGAISVRADERDAVNVEFLVEQLPFLSSLDELERIGALSHDVIGQIRSNVTAGSIMLVEAGAGLSEHDVSEPETLLDATLGNSAGNVVEAEVEAHYLDQFDAVRERMVGPDGAGQTGVPLSGPAAPAAASPTPVTATAVDRADDLDDLIVDLNRLYKR